MCLNMLNTQIENSQKTVYFVKIKSNMEKVPCRVKQKGLQNTILQHYSGLNGKNENKSFCDINKAWVFVLLFLESKRCLQRKAFLIKFFKHFLCFPYSGNHVWSCQFIRKVRMTIRKSKWGTKLLFSTLFLFSNPLLFYSTIQNPSPFDLSDPLDLCTR